MSLRIHDSATHGVRPFEPVTPGRVGIYLCGATVQGPPHIGHLRSAIAFDCAVRWLRRSGYDVLLVRNVTDIDDKILAKSAEAGVPWWEWANRYERAFNAAYDALGVERPNYEPRATGHMSEMVELMNKLVESGHAYTGSGANVYFDVRSLPTYGALTRQTLDKLPVDDGEDGGQGDTDKRHPRDFALWKSPRAGEPGTAAWPSPYGRGRPGWHLECSAMANRYLGDTFDIHGGGIDLRFPHHENEQAQSHAAGHGFARYWMHNAWVTTGGEKMSKSLGNSLLVSEILKTTPAPVLRFALGSVHYRSTVEYSPQTIVEAGAAWEKITNFTTRAVALGGLASAEDVAGANLPEAFTRAMNDDFNVAGALAAVWEQIKVGNAALARSDKDGALESQVLVRAMLDVLGLDPHGPTWGEAATGRARGERRALEALVDSVIEARAQARAERDWASADRMRDMLAGAGIVLEDGANGSTWHVSGE